MVLSVKEIPQDDDPDDDIVVPVNVPWYVPVLSPVHVGTYGIAFIVPQSFKVFVPKGRTTHGLVAGTCDSP